MTKTWSWTPCKKLQLEKYKLKLAHKKNIFANVSHNQMQLERSLTIKNIFN